MSRHPKIAIPVPHSQKPAYVQKSLPQYVSAIEKAGGEAVVIELAATAHEIASQIKLCQGVLLPGSAADVDPQKYGAARHEKTAEPDPLRDAADELLLQDAHNMRKPIFCICYGLQSLNVWRTGSLVQDIASTIQTPINHAAGRTVPYAHNVQVDPLSNLASLLHADPEKKLLGYNQEARCFDFAVNSSHHQAAEVVGDGLRVAARSPKDGVIEALENVNSGHFVLAVQWHPERSYDEDAASRALFRAFVDAC